MKHFETIINLLVDFGGEVFINFLIYGFIGSMIGLFGTIYIIRKRSKAGKFERPNGLWQGLVSIEKIYLPIVVMIAFGVMASIFGINTTINEHVENSVNSTIDKMSINVHNLRRIQNNSSVQLSQEALLVKELSRNNYIKIINTIIAKSILKELNYPKSNTLLIQKIQNQRWDLIKIAMKYTSSYFITDIIDRSFNSAYRYAFILFVFTFLKIPIIEAVLFFIYRKISDSTSESHLESTFEFVP